MAERNVSIRLSVEDAETVRRTLDQVGASGQQLAQKLGEASKAARAADIAAYGAELDRLRAKYNPLFAAQQQYRAALAEINQAQRVGAISAEEATAAIQREAVALNAHVAALNRGSGGGAIGNMRQFGTVAQQAGFQVGDFFTQIASGQNAMVAFTQQGSQMLQFFGAAGAVAGAVLAVVGALVIAFRNAAGGASSAAEAAKKLDAALKDANSVLETHQRLGAGLKDQQENEIKRVGDLARYYRSLTGELREFEKTRLQVRELNLKEESAGLAAQANAGLGAIQSLSRTLGNVTDLTRLQNARRTARGLQPLEGPPAQAVQARAAIEEFNQAGPNSPQALEKLYTDLVRISQIEGPFSKSILEAARAIEKPAIQARELALRLEEVRKGQELLSKSPKELEQLAGRPDAIKKQNDLLKEQIALETRAAVEYDKQRENAHKRAQQIIDADAKRQQSLEKYIRGLEGSAEAEKLNSTEKQVQLALQEAQNKLIDEYGHKLRDLTEKEKERIATAVRNREQEKAATQELERFSERAFDRIGAAITEAFVQGKAAAIDFRGVMMGVLSEIAQEFVKLAILNPLKNIIFGQNNPTAADIFKPRKEKIPGIPSLNFAGFFASGTDFAPRGLAVVGESGPELINFRGGEQVISANRTRTILSRGQGGNQYFIDARGADAGAVERIKQALIQLAGPGVVERRAITAVTSARQRGMVPA